MSNICFLSDDTAEALANAWAARMNSGTINVYNGTQPVNANTALAGNTLLVTLTFGNPAFGAAAPGGIITANAIAASNAIATGTATFARLLKSDGITVVQDMAVNTTGSALNFSSTAFVIGGLITLATLVLTVPET